MNPNDTDECNPPPSTEEPRAIEGMLLAHYEGYWYVLDPTRGDVSVVPDNENGLAVVPSALPKSCVSRATIPAHAPQVRVPVHHNPSCSTDATR